MTALLKILDWSSLNENDKAAALSRPAVRASDEIDAIVAAIVEDVRNGDDDTLRSYAERFDGGVPDTLAVDARERSSAAEHLTPEQRDAIDSAVINVETFHRAQLEDDLRIDVSPGVVCERLVRPLRSVGLYVPAGSAPLPSTAVMLSVPARLAGCEEIVLCTPPRNDGLADPAVVHAAERCGVTRVFKVGGAQAVAAMAYGCGSVPKVDKIFGPGNAYVTAAKSMVARDPAGADLDLPAGPSEVLVIADDTADPRHVALDLLSQAEHGPDSQVLLLTNSERLARAVSEATALETARLPRREIIEQSLSHAAAIVVADIAEAISVSNVYAPEHLILQFQGARARIAEVRNAGSVFVGRWTPESVGDYCSGTNHVLPTYGYARSMSGLSVSDFTRRMTVQELTRDGLAALGPTVRTLAELEGLEAHARAVTVRLEEDSR